MRLFFVTAACAAALALPALADPATPSTGAAPAATPATGAAPASTSAPKADEGIVCKMKAVTGTRFSKKVCTTKAQRDEEAAQGRDALGASTHVEVSKPAGG